MMAHSQQQQGQAQPTTMEVAVAETFTTTSLSSTSSSCSTSLTPSTDRSVDHKIIDDVDKNPVRTLIQNWLLRGMLLPAAVAAFAAWFTSSATTLSLQENIHWTTIIVTALATPLLAIVQGSLGILQFRVRFGAAPVPVTPAHGVVYVEEQSSPNEQFQQKRTATTSLEAAQQLPPVRLLVIGDSLAIGVGQRTSATPVLPQVIAQTLSRKLQRVVYWTCHGAPGASTGWIVRELERGVGEGVVEDEGAGFLNENDVTDECEPMSSSSSSTSSTSTSRDSYLHNIKRLLSRQSSFSASEDAVPMSDDSVLVWRNRLSAHRRRFNPDLLGPYDIVVVLTGSNDLKSAFFPFLLTGEDAEFRRQAQQRGGSYTKELRRLLETLHGKMSLQIQNIRAQVLTQVEAATESVREKVEETMEKIAPGSIKSFESLFVKKKEPEQLESKPLQASDSNQTDTDESEDDVDSDSDSASIQQGHSRHFPLVVLPGMPARALPIFRTLPLRWLSCPIVDIMDRHKQDLANLHPGQVLFVPAPALRHVHEYEARNGTYWKERCDESIALCMRDPPLRHYADRLVQSMQEYYASRKSWTWRKQSALFAEDQVHPNDEGYDFWGRYIAHAIVDEWQE